MQMQRQFQFLPIIINLNFKPTGISAYINKPFLKRSMKSKLLFNKVGKRGNEGEFPIEAHLTRTCRNNNVQCTNSTKKPA